jgi:tRNA threonylcarbamoyladenosine biosynthesis protein TsaB
MKLLAFDTSTDVLSIAVSRGAQLWQQQGVGGPQASSGLIAGVLELLRQSGLALAQLDAICFGCGPGSFTGLRTACAVAQGLGFGAQVPVLPVNSLLAVAEAARFSHLADQPSLQLSALLDARMDEIYVAHYAYAQGHWSELQAAHLQRPHSVTLPDSLLLRAAAGNVFAVYGDRLVGLPPPCEPAAGRPAGAGAPRIPALPLATAMLRLAPQLLAQGRAVPAAQALPTYIRDKVAQTTAERAAIKAALAAAT